MRFTKQTFNTMKQRKKPYAKATVTSFALLLGLSPVISPSSVLANTVKDEPQKVVEQSKKPSDMLTSLTKELKNTEKQIEDKKSDENKVNAEERKEEIENVSKAEVQIKKDGTEEEQFQEELQKLAEKTIEIQTTKDEVKTESAVNDLTSIAEDKKDASTNESKETTNNEEKTDESDTKIKKVQVQNSEDTSSDVKQYVYNDLLISTEGFDANASGVQDVTVNIRTMSQIEKQIIELSDVVEIPNVNTLLDEDSILNVSTQDKSNSSVYSRVMKIGMVDTSGPDIKLTTNETTLTVGDTFDIKNYVQSVTDEQDGNLEYKVEGEVNTGKSGEYKVNVSAEDLTGNVSTATLTVKVQNDLQKTFYNKIAEAAISQIGVTQDCTMLVTNSLKAVGINFHGWPYEYAQLGEWTNNPVPGDIIIYEGHVALYIGNGRAIHGGWHGWTTVEWSVECGNALVGYIHVTPPSSYLV